MNNIQPEPWEDIFTRFYWEIEEYNGRERGLPAYIEIIRSIVKDTETRTLEKVYDYIYLTSGQNGRKDILDFIKNLME